ncbi:TrmH family RNA methyltransferase [Pandoraea sputorum]|uniref:23S rRNA (Guanosine-2'-O-)-methyltransferase RlmB n=1 Tax=Pandoraea sputorum TaxID=93222 RepID=A0A239SJJ8_9BURK|nr:RNA methyltransferase [Pandoraea sputorum]AJC17290.1 RNA methyltransferase [Pandoraea sputorum]SNU85567.1 23S rRNA (guanosine-2'-O-)-methyltransferase RlmB [Pandoraea sputorum]VVE37156.1 RNA methyltransferase [Pandoraea sputorum]
MKLISSKDNPFYKRLKLLAQSNQQRRKLGQTLLEGVHLADAYLGALGQPLVCVAADSALDNDEVAQIWARVEADRRVCLPEALFEPLSTLVNGVSLLFVVEMPSGRLPASQTTDCVILDAVQDAGNVGSILRSAAAAGVRDVYCMSGTALTWSSKVLRSGMGAHFSLNIVEHCTPDSLAPRLSVPLLATSLQASTSLYEQDLRSPVAWVFGNEGAGVSPHWLERVQTPIRIPQPGGMESLNVAACAAICLFEAVRQRLS